MTELRAHPPDTLPLPTYRRWGPMTLEELLALPYEGVKLEWVAEEAIMTPAGMEQEDLGAELIHRLKLVVNRDKLGRVYGSSTGYLLTPEKLRSPDVSFVRRERLPGGRSPRSFGTFAPDLAVAILAPEWRLKDLGEKLLEYFEAGVRLVWVLDPTVRTVTVYRSLTQTRTLYEGDILDGEDVVPGFTCRVGDLFATLDPIED